MCCYSFLFSSLPAWRLHNGAIHFLPLLSLLPSKFFNFSPFLSWPCFIFCFSIAHCALMALIPFLLHFLCMFPGNFISPVFDLFICLISLTSFLTMPLFFIICLYSGSLLPPLFSPLLHPGGHFMLQHPNCLYFTRDQFTAYTIPYVIAHPPFSSFLDFLTLEGGANRPSRNVGYQPTSNAKEERMPQLHRGGSPKFRVFCTSVMSVQR